MAIVSRRYVMSGPSAAALIEYVRSTGATPNTSFPFTAIDINIDDTIPGITTMLDDYMGILGLTYAPTFNPAVFGTTLVGFYGGTPVPKPAVTGSRTDGTALTSLITALTSLGLISNSTTVPQDGPSGVYVPEAPADFTALGLPVPDYLWLCQEVSGDLNNAIGAAVPLVQTGAGHLYQQSITGWTRRFVGTDGVTVGQSWRTSAAALDLAAGQSCMMIALGSYTPNAANTLYMVIGATGPDGLSTVGTTGALRDFNNSNPTNGTVPQGPITTVRPFVWFRNATSDNSGARSNTDSIVGVHSELAITGQLKALGNTAATAALAARYGWFAVYKGANAEFNPSTYLATLGW